MTADLKGGPGQRVHVILVSPRPSLLAELLGQIITRSDGFSADQFAGPAVDAAASADRPPHVVLVEVSGADEGCGFARACRDRWQSASLLLLVSDAGSWCSRLATDVGAAGWITCHQGLEELLSAITVVARTGRLGRAPAGKASRRSGNGFELDALTGREREVLQLLAAARSLDDIASRLGIAANTVRTHVQNVITKMGVNSRIEAVLLAQRAGAISSRHQVLDLREPVAEPKPEPRPLHAQR